VVLLSSVGSEHELLPVSISETIPSEIISSEDYYLWKAEYADRMRSESRPDGLRREMVLALSNPYVHVVVDETSGEFSEGGNNSGSGSYMNSCMLTLPFQAQAGIVLR
jgi:hypothetical protein